MRQILLLSCLLFCGCLKPVDVVPIPDSVTPVVSSKLMVVVVENREDRKPDSPEADLKFWEEIRQAGHEFRLVDQDNEFAKRFAKQVNRHGVPCLLIVRISDGRVFKSCPRPSETEIAALVKKYGAK